MTKSVTQSSVLSPQHLFADVVVDLLRRGARVRFQAPGWSMYPTIKNGEVIGVEPVKPSQVKWGDIILYRNGRGVIAHRVVRIEKERLTALRSVSLKERLREPRGAAFGLEARGAAYSLEERPLRASRSVALEDRGSCLKRSDPRTPACGRQEVLLKQSGRFESSASSEAILPPGRMPLWGGAKVEGRSSNGAVAECSRRAGGPSGPEALSGAFFERSDRFFILRGDASAVCDEPITAGQVLGKVVFVERDGCLIPLDNTKSKISQAARLYTYRIKRAISNRLSAIIYRRRKSYKIDPCGP
jgi:hypothetical protein